MEPRIETLPEKLLVGVSLRMSLAQNRTGELWKSFMPRRKEIVNTTGNSLYSLQVYPIDYFENFSVENHFEKWAAVEVTESNDIPPEMQNLVIPAGLYAVFLHKGAASTGAKTFQYIFTKWLPESSYAIDDRPHFELLGAKYKNDDPDSEEEFWIPVKLKT